MSLHPLPWIDELVSRRLERGGIGRLGGESPGVWCSPRLGVFQQRPRGPRRAKRPRFLPTASKRMRRGMELEVNHSWRLGMWESGTARPTRRLCRSGCARQSLAPRIVSAHAREMSLFPAAGLGKTPPRCYKNSPASFFRNPMTASRHARIALTALAAVAVGVLAAAAAKAAASP